MGPKAALQPYHISLVLLSEIALVHITTLLNPLVCSHASSWFFSNLAQFVTLSSLKYFLHLPPRTLLYVDSLPASLASPSQDSFSGTFSHSLNIEAPLRSILGCLLSPVSTCTALVISPSLVALYSYRWWQRWYAWNNPCPLPLSMLWGGPLCLVLTKGNMSAVRGNKEQVFTSAVVELLERSSSEIQVTFGRKPLRRAACPSLDYITWIRNKP